MGKTTDGIASFLGQLGQTAASAAKIALLSRRPTVKAEAADGDEIVVLGNGPSLNATVADHADFLNGRKKLAVNFAARTPLFLSLRPDFYVLADPHFFNAAGDANVGELWEVFAKKVDWPMTLFVPVNTRCPELSALPKSNPHVSVRRYNTTPVEGFGGFRHWAYRMGLGMPRPRNVLIPSIMLAINSGFKTVYVAGADHSWMKTLSVDDDNRVISVQPHFYKDNEQERTRVNTEYMRYPLHQIVHSFYVAFRAYHLIRAYAASRNAAVWNITPGSFIDAFPRKKL